MVSRIWPILALVVTAACSTSPTREQVQRFSTALTAASDSISSTITRVGEFERDATLEEANVRYLSVAPSAATIIPVLPSNLAANSEAARNALGKSLDFLSEYARQLSILASGEDVAAAQASVTRAGGLASEAIKKFGQQSGEAAGTTDAVTAGIGVIANIVIERRTAAAISAAVEKAHPDIVRLADFLSTQVIGNESRGLEAALRTNLDFIRISQRRALYEISRDPSVSRFDRDLAFRAAAARDRANATLLALPGATRDALAAMVRAHAKLVEPATAGPSIGEFVRAVDRLISLYQSARTAQAG